MEKDINELYINSIYFEILNDNSNKMSLEFVIKQNYINNSINSNVFKESKGSKGSNIYKYIDNKELFI